ncbi:MAG: aminomethyltransferase family protein [Acidobacteriota bacterium]
MAWKEWAGYYAVRSYDTCHELEYFTLHHAAGLIDVSPLFKYEVSGPGAAAYLSYLTVKDIEKLRTGRVTYLCWCDDDGKVLDDGTISRLDDTRFRVTAAEPAYAWLQEHAERYRVVIEDSSDRLGVLSLQGPTSRDLLRQVCGRALDGLRYFGVISAAIGNVPVEISRTGYTGELGYEIWIPRDHCLDVWDTIRDAGGRYRLQPVGLDAMDMARIEAGFIMNGVDYFSAHHCLIDSRKSSPFEIGLGRAVQLDRAPFIGQAALRREKADGSRWALVGLEYDWDAFEALFTAVGLPPQVPSGAWRSAVPVYDQRDRQIGQATSGTWSPLLKKNLALASVRAPLATPGTRLKVEVTVEYERKRIGATVVRKPFFDPERKKAIRPGAAAAGGLR